MSKPSFMDLVAQPFRVRELYQDASMYNVTEEDDLARAKRLANFVLKYGVQRCKRAFEQWAIEARMCQGNYDEESAILDVMASLAYRVRRAALVKGRKQLKGKK